MVGLLAQAFLTPLFFIFSARYLFSHSLQEDVECDASRCANQVERWEARWYLGALPGHIQWQPSSYMTVLPYVELSLVICSSRFWRWVLRLSLHLSSDSPVCLVESSASGVQRLAWPLAAMDFDKERVIQNHSVLLSQVATDSTFQKLGCSPLLTVAALRLAQQQRSLISQYGLLARVMRTTSQQTTQDSNNASESRLFFNTSVPSSTFICGSQGSGKSYTLSCLLENCLARSDATVLPRPLTCLLFHYDEFISDNAGSPCEAAFLASVSGVKVRVLCSPTNIATIKVSILYAIAQINAC